MDFRFPQLAKLEHEIKGNAKVNSAVAFEQALFDCRYVISKVHRQFRVERDFDDAKLLTLAGQVLHDLFGLEAVAYLDHMFWDIRMSEHFILQKLKLQDQLLACTAEGLAAALKTRDLDHMSFVNAKKKTSVENAAFNASFVLKNQRTIPDSDLLKWHIAKREPQGKLPPGKSAKTDLRKPPIECEWIPPIDVTKDVRFNRRLHGSELGVKKVDEDQNCEWPPVNVIVDLNHFLFTSMLECHERIKLSTLTETDEETLCIEFASYACIVRMLDQHMLTSLFCMLATMPPDSCNSVTAFYEALVCITTTVAPAVLWQSQLLLTGFLLPNAKARAFHTYAVFLILKNFQRLVL